MLIAGIPKPRNKFVKIYYYLMRFLGPFLIFSLSFILALYYISSTYYSRYKSSTDNVERNFYLTSMSVLIFPSIMVIISLSYTVLGDPGSTRESIRRYKGKENSFMTQQFLDSLPRCHKCGLPKPPRAHHCSTCGRCHLKMDHHCPSIGACIALWNQQPFIVMLEWCIIEIIAFIFATAIYSFISNSKEEKFLNAALCFVLILSSFFLSSFKNNIMKRVINNTTVIEEMNGEHGKYNIGADNNVRQVFGSGNLRFYIPKYPALTGFEWALEEYCAKESLEKNDSEYAFFPNVTI